MTTPTLPQAAQIALDALVLSSTDASRINPHQQHVDAAITALREALAAPPAAPADMVMVPRGPTVEMRRAAAKWLAHYHMMRAVDKTNAITDAWQAMIAAAPAQPAAPAVPDGMALVTRDDANNYCRILTLLGIEEEGDPVAEIVRLHTPPPPANLSTAPAPLNTNDKAMWITGWNECRDSVIASLAAPAVLEPLTLSDDDLLRIATTLGLPFGMLDTDYCKSMEIEPGTRSYGEVTCEGMVRFGRAVIAAARQAAPVSPPGWREALQFYADGSHFNMAVQDAWDTVSGEPTNFWCDEAGTATVEDGTVAKMALAGTPLPNEDEDTPPAAPQSVPAPAVPDGWVMVPQTLVSQLQDALEVAEAGLLWYQDANPDQVSECDAETMAEIAAAIAAAPPAVPAPAVPDDFCGNLDSPHDSGDTKYCDVSEKTVDYATEALERLAAAAPAVREPQPFTKAQLHRLYVNSPELHKDAPSEAAFTRIVQLAESAHGITGGGNG